MGIFKKIPDEIVLFYNFMLVVISLFMYVPNYFLIIGLIIAILPFIKKITNNKKILLFEEIGKSLIADEINTSLIKKGQKPYLDYGRIKKENPEGKFWTILKKGINNLSCNEILIALKTSNGDIIPCELNINKDNIEFMGIHEKEQEMREIKERDEDMKNKFNLAPLFQFANTMLLVLCVFTIFWGVSKIFENLGVLTTTLNDFPDKVADKIGDTLVDFLDKGADSINNAGDNIPDIPSMPSVPSGIV